MLAVKFMVAFYLPYANGSVLIRDKEQYELRGMIQEQDAQPKKLGITINYNKTITM